MTAHPFKIGDKVRRSSEPDHLPSLFPYKIGDVCEVKDVRSVTDAFVGEIPQIFVMDRWTGARWWTLEERKGKPAANIFLLGVEELVSKITYKPGWSVEVKEEGDRVYVQLSVNAFAEASMDSVKRDGTRTPWKSAKRYLSPHMCRQELVGVVFGLIKDAELHEIHEWFRYKNASIFNPHLDPDALAELARKKTSFVVRENAMTMEEPA